MSSRKISIIAGAIIFLVGGFAHANRHHSHHHRHSGLHIGGFGLGLDINFDSDSDYYYNDGYGPSGYYGMPNGGYPYAAPGNYGMPFNGYPPTGPYGMPNNGYPSTNYYGGASCQDLSYRGCMHNGNSCFWDNYYGTCVSRY